jgi:hypothetical protein
MLHMVFLSLTQGLYQQARWLVLTLWVSLLAQALLLAGQCLQYKFLTTIPPQLNPWPPREQRDRRRTVIGMGDLTHALAGGAAQK